MLTFLIEVIQALKEKDEVEETDAAVMLRYPMTRSNVQYFCNFLRPPALLLVTNRRLTEDSAMVCRSRFVKMVTLGNLFVSRLG